MKNSHYSNRNGERGIALVTSLMSTMFILALGMAVVLSTTTDTGTTRAQRSGEQAFFAADAGIGIARRSLTQAFKEAIAARLINKNPYETEPVFDPPNFPAVAVIPDPDGSWNDPFYAGIKANAEALATTAARVNRFTDINDTTFDVTFYPLTGTITRAGTGAFPTGTEVLVLRYWIEVTGKTGSGGRATVNETGRLTANINMIYDPGSPTSRSFSFSGFGAFFDNGDTQPHAALAAGTFSGPVHTNTHFAINSQRTVTFRNVVSQVDDGIRYGDNNFFSNASGTGTNRAIPTSNIPGIEISGEGYKVTAPVPLPENTFSQEFAVINATGITDIDSTTGLPKDMPAGATDSSGNPITILDGQGRVTTAALVANLRRANNSQPGTTSGVLNNGVYVSSADGSNITGAGIYVQGDATDVQLIAETNGNQVIKIWQGSTVTTVTQDFSNNRTTISSSLGSTTYNGVFTDKGDPANHRNGAMLFVGNSSGNGSIASLRGGKDSSANKKAIASSSAITITAQRNVTITGEIKYNDAVAASDGTPVTNVNSISNVLGIFTNNGNVQLAPNSSYVSGSGLSLEMNAAVVAFNSKTTDDSGQARGIDGSIVYTGGTNPGTNDRWRLVGSRVQAKISSIGFNYRDIYFDTRFSGGHFRPPFFPGTSYALGPPPEAGALGFLPMDSPAATAMSWFRNNN
jgi:hypothetical protein